MIGNDIVDLKLASIESNWQRKGFLNKVFTKKEQALILNATNPFIMVWLLWSMKESAYKIYVQQYGQRFFAPKKLECYLINNFNGMVLINNTTYKTQSVITNDCIYTTAILLESRKEMIHKRFAINEVSHEHQSKLAYHQLKETVSKIERIPYGELYIKKTKAGVPNIYWNTTIINIPFSITHHGSFGAISVLN